MTPSDSGRPARPSRLPHRGGPRRDTSNSHGSYQGRNDHASRQAPYGRGMGAPAEGQSWHRGSRAPSPFAGRSDRSEAPDARMGRGVVRFDGKSPSASRGVRPMLNRPDRSEAKSSWGNEADWYGSHVEDPSSYHQQVVKPNLLRCVAPQVGEKGLDLACGQGVMTRAFVEAGCEMMGVDTSEALIAAAQRVPVQGKTPSYVAASAHELGFVDSESMDFVVFVLAIQNIHNPSEVLKEVSRVLRPGGRVALVLNHPCFRIPKATMWGWDAETRVQFRRVDAYLSEAKIRIQMHPGADPSATTISYHHPLSFFVKALARADFAVTNLEEWTSNRKSDSGPRAQAENKSRAEIPLFLFLEGRKSL